MTGVKKFKFRNPWKDHRQCSDLVLVRRRRRNTLLPCKDVLRQVDSHMKVVFLSCSPKCSSNRRNMTKRWKKKIKKKKENMKKGTRTKKPPILTIPSMFQ